MFTFLLAVLATTIATDSLEVRFVANAGVELYDGQTTVLVDLPYQSGYSGYMEYVFDDILGRGSVVSAITHRHLDHVETEQLLSTDWHFFGPDEVSRSIPAERVLPDSTEQFGDFVLTKIRTPHAGIEHNSILVEWRGVKLYFVGDTDDPSKLLSRKDLDILFITPWLSCAAERSGSRPAARRTFLYHHHADQRYGSCGAPEVLAPGESFLVPGN